MRYKNGGFKRKMYNETYIRLYEKQGLKCYVTMGWRNTLIHKADQTSRKFSIINVCCYVINQVVIELNSAMRAFNGS